MSPRVRIIGIGQPAAGDDGVGLEVITLLRATGVAEDVELLELSDPSPVLALLSTEAKVIIVDAVLGSPVGAVLKLSLNELDANPPISVSTHGVGVVSTLRLARALDATLTDESFELVAIRIAPPRVGHRGLSPEVSASAQRAAKLIRDSIAAQGPAAHGLMVREP